MNFRMEHLHQKLSQVKYDLSIGIKDIVLETITVRGVTLLQLLAQIDAERELTPHLHEVDEEVGIVLTSGMVYVGDAQKKDGKYVVDAEGRIVVDWQKPHSYPSGETFATPDGKAHQFAAGENEPFIYLITVPKAHITGEDRKFTTYP